MDNICGEREHSNIDEMDPHSPRGYAGTHRIHFALSAM